MPRRAIHDPTVVEAWQRLAGPHRRRSRALVAIVFWCWLAGIVVALVYRTPLVVLVLMPVTAIAVLATKCGAWRLRCPRCGKVPVTSIARQSAESVDICCHCEHWLRWARRLGDDGSARVTRNRVRGQRSSLAPRLSPPS